jgi:hypothetical protein
MKADQERTSSLAANPNILPLAFLLSIMRDPAVAPDLRIKVAQAAAPFCHPKPTGAQTDPADGAKMVIDTLSRTSVLCCSRRR